MDYHALLIAGLTDSRGQREFDPFTADIGKNGLTPSALTELADKWSLKSWTCLDSEAAIGALDEQVRAGRIIQEEGKYLLTEVGRAEFRESVKRFLSTPENLHEFHLGLAFRRAISDAEYEASLRVFSERLADSIRGNTEKAHHMKGSVWEGLMSVLLAQMHAVQDWIEKELDSVPNA